MPTLPSIASVKYCAPMNIEQAHNSMPLTEEDTLVEGAVRERVKKLVGRFPIYQG